jgi:hypothetical protein
MKRKWYVMQASSLLLSSETNLEESCIWRIFLHRLRAVEGLLSSENTILCILHYIVRMGGGTWNGKH